MIIFCSGNPTPYSIYLTMSPKRPISAWFPLNNIFIKYQIVFRGYWCDPKGFLMIKIVLKIFKYWYYNQKVFLEIQSGTYTTEKPIIKIFICQKCAWNHPTSSILCLLYDGNQAEIGCQVIEYATKGLFRKLSVKKAQNLHLYHAKSPQLRRIYSEPSKTNDIYLLYIKFHAL